MDNTLKKHTYIPPYWVDLLVGISAIVFIYLIAMWESEPGKPFDWDSDIYARFIRFAGIFILVKSCVHWSIHKEFIVVRFLWIPIRIIRWEMLSQAEYVYRWSASGKSYDKRKGQGIFITLKGCPCFSPEIDALDMFLLRHPFRSLFIRFTPRNQQRYVAIFKKYYPDLDFQIGYEENLKKGKPYVDDNLLQQ